MINALDSFVQDCNAKPPQSAIIFLGSHGLDNGIQTTDGEILKFNKDVLSKFYDKNCSGLKGKPKLFLVNACQNFTETDNIEHLGGITSDTVIWSAQVPGFSAFRDPGYGSHFVHCLTFVVAECAKDLHLEEIMKEVASILQNRDCVDEEANQAYGQTPSYRVLPPFKSLYFL